mmetsp:Transcript_4061/g.11741  ORF Transcript_4061/g.11741 Transcript_4061/m.11741 type:complete len:220 (-) Transcript_4061:855-1514(-)
MARTTPCCMWCSRSTWSSTHHLLAYGNSPNRRRLPSLVSAPAVAQQQRRACSTCPIPCRIRWLKEPAQTLSRGTGLAAVGLAAGASLPRAAGLGAAASPTAVIPAATSTSTGPSSMAPALKMTALAVLPLPMACSGPLIWDFRVLGPTPRPHRVVRRDAYHGRGGTPRPACPCLSTHVGRGYHPPWAHGNTRPRGRGRVLAGPDSAGHRRGIAAGGNVA